MGLLDKLANIFTRAQKVSLGPPSVPIFSLSANTASGQAVTETTCLNLPGVLCAVRCIAEGEAGLPLFLYERTPEGGKRRASEHPVYRILHDAPNPLMTSFQFREFGMTQLLLWGNFFAEIERDQAGRPLALWAIPSNRVNVTQNDRGEVIYQVTQASGGSVNLASPDVLHVAGLSTTNGLVGMSPIRVAAEALGIGMALDQTAAKFFGGGMQLSGVISNPGNKPSLEMQKNIRQSMEDAHSGKPWRFLYLWGGESFSAVSVPPEAGQFLQSRAYSILEICRIFNIDPAFLKDYSSGKYDNVEAQFLNFVQTTLRPWLIRIEQAISQKLLTPDERERFFAEHLVEGLLRADTLTRYQAHQIALSNGWENVDEVRELENRNPLPNGIGAKYLQPLNHAERTGGPTKDQIDSILAIMSSGLDTENKQRLINTIAPGLGLVVKDEQPIRDQDNPATDFPPTGNEPGSEAD